MIDEGTVGVGPIYGPQDVDLPRGDDTAQPNQEPKRSTAPWDTEPDRGAPVIGSALSRHRKRGQR